jgi:hypothetical protein
MMNAHRFRAILLFSVVVFSSDYVRGLVAAEKLSEDQVAFFETKIRPVFVNHCYKCHSKEFSSSKGGLRLDVREGLLKGGDSGPAIVPGNPKESLLLSALRHEDIQMPPKSKLPEKVVADVELWIKMGAPDPRTESVAKTTIGVDLEKAQKFWAFQKPERHKRPSVKQLGWPKNEIDAFILAELEKKNLQVAAPADRRQLIRRAYMDVIGLPPEPEAVERFVADKSNTAFE